jgi:hypothetical protein
VFAAIVVAAIAIAAFALTRGGDAPASTNESAGAIDRG